MKKITSLIIALILIININFVISQACIPNCNQKECGEDGCGGICSCNSEEICLNHPDNNMPQCFKTVGELSTLTPGAAIIDISTLPEGLTLITRKGEEFTIYSGRLAKLEFFNLTNAIITIIALVIIYGVVLRKKLK